MAAADRPRIVGGEVAVEVPARGTRRKGLSKELGGTIPRARPSREGAEGRLSHQGIGVGFSTLSEAKTVLDAAYAVAAPTPASGPRTAGRAARDAAEATRVRMVLHMAAIAAAQQSSTQVGCVGVMCPLYVTLG